MPAAPNIQPPATEPITTAPVERLPFDDPAPRGRSRIWFNNEVLLWWIQGMQIPPLALTTSPTVPAANIGVFGAFGTTSLFGPGEVDTNLRFGWRTTVGTWLDDDQRLALEFQFLMLANSGAQFSAVSPTGNPIISRFAINAVTLLQNSDPVAVPGVSNGAIHISTATSGLVSTGLIVRETFHRTGDLCDSCQLCSGGCGGCRGGCDGSDREPKWICSSDALIGFRYVYLGDHLAVDDTVNAVVALNNLPPGATMQRSDRFDSHNRFYGLDLGVSNEFQRGAWSIGTLAKVAVGFNNASVDILGVRNTTGVVTPSGLLAQTTNAGHFTRTTASAVPELGAKLSYAIRPNMKLSVGYSFLYWYHLARAGNQVNPFIDPAFLLQAAPGAAAPARPEFTLQERSIWVQGVSLGFEWRY